MPAGQLRADGDVAPYERTGSLRADADLSDLSQVYQTLGSCFPDIPKGLALRGAVQLDAAVNGALDAAEVVVHCKGRNVGGMNLTANSFQLIGNRKGSLLEAEGVTTVALDLQDESRNRLLLKGKIDSLKQGAQNITIDTLSFDAPKIAMVDVLENQDPIRLQWHQDTLIIDALRMKSGEAALSLTGALSTSGRQSLQLALSDFELSRLSGLWENQQPLSGGVSATVVVQGAMGSPVIKAEITGKNLSGYQMTGADVAADLAYADSKGTLSVLLSKNGSERLIARGTVSSQLQLMPFLFDLGTWNFQNYRL
jgi:hypothetical protein